MKTFIPTLKNSSLLFLMLAFAAFAHSQSVFFSNGSAGSATVSTNISTFNSYYPVRGITGHQITYGPSLFPYNRDTFRIGDRVLIIQMSGPLAGTWQWDSVQALGNLTITVSGIFRTFDLTGVIQVIRVPQFTSLHVTNDGHINTLPWQPADSVGGVLSFMVHDHFVIDSGGTCDVTGAGYQHLSGSASAGLGGSGGTGGAGGGLGLPGGDSATIIGSGFGGGGDGGQFGHYGVAGAASTSATALACPDCGGAVATNTSILNTRFTRTLLLLGGAATGGTGGQGGRGAGGGGGGTATSGTAGGPGGSGGAGGAGGDGGGVIVYSAGYLDVPAHVTVFIAAGTAGDSAVNGTTGAQGGNGGDGAGSCATAGVGGGGRGATGGNGGNGGNGGGGGVVYSLLAHASTNFTTASYRTNGGRGGKGGKGGRGGPGGANGAASGAICGGGGTGPNGYNGLDGANGNDGNDGTSGGSNGGSAGGGGIDVIQDCALSPLVANNTGNQVTGDGCPYTFDPALLTVSGGYGSYTYDYFTGPSSCSLGLLTPYTVLVSDSIGCVGVFPTAVYHQGDDFYLSITGRTDIVCSADGTLSYDISQNTNVACLDNWVLYVQDQNGNQVATNAGSGNGSFTLTGLPAGQYDYEVWSGSDCLFFSNSGFFNINGNPNLPSGSEYDTVCSGIYFNWTADGNTYYQSGIYTSTIIGGSAAGCDSIAILHLTVFDPITLAGGPIINEGCTPLDINDLTIRGGDGHYNLNTANSYNFCTVPGYIDVYNINVTDHHNCVALLSYQYYASSDVFSFIPNSQTNASCSNSNDGLFNFTITANNPEACEFSWDYSISGPNGYFHSNYLMGTIPGNTIQTLTGLAAGTYTYSLYSGVTCPYQSALGTFTITSSSGVSHTQYDTICSTTPFTWNGHSYSQPGIYSDTLIGGSATGCDSITTLNLAVYTPPSFITYDSICPGLSVSFGLHSYSQSGTYTDTLIGASATGCDSIITLHLVVYSPLSLITYDSICHGQSLSAGLHSYTQSGIYTDTLTGMHGCDSIVTTHLFVYPAISVNLYDTLSASHSITIAGHIYTQTGIYTDTLSSMHSCDSIIHLYLFVGDSSTFAHLFDTICQGFAVVLSGHSYTVSGTYIDTIRGTVGPDTIVTLSLTVTQAVLVNVFDTIAHGAVITVGGHTYTQSGLYIDTLRNRIGCDSIRALHLTVTPHVNSITDPTQPITSLDIYPNPNQGTFNMDINMNSFTDRDASVSIFNTIGQVIHKEGMTLHSGANRKQLFLDPATASGVYIIQLTIGSQYAYYRIVVDK